MAARVHPDAAQHAAQQAEAFDDAAQHAAKQAEQTLDDAAQKVQQKVDNVLDKARLKAVDLGNEKLNLREVREALRTSCNELPELMEVAIEAWDSFGMGGFKDTLNAGVNGIAQKAKGELEARAEAGKSRARDVVGEFEGDVDEVIGDNEILKAFLSIMGPSRAQGADANKKDPLTYNEERGLALHEAIPQWKWVMGPFSWLGGGTKGTGDAGEKVVNAKGKSLFATVFLLASFCINLWVLAVYNLFTDGDTGECCQ